MGIYDWKDKLVILVIILIIVGLGGCFFGGADFKRSWKSTKSNYTGGLNRTVTVYDYNGKPIKSWTGKFDVSNSENETWFDDAGGKRVIIHGGIVINQEN